jgi:glycosyltransferase involved in cell wall biosynthesis
MRLLVLTGNSKRASFRERVLAYVGPLESAGISTELAEIPAGLGARWRLYGKARLFDGVFLHKKGLSFADAYLLRLSARKLIYDFDDAIMYKQSDPLTVSAMRLRRFARTVRAADLVIAGNSYLAAHAMLFNKRTAVLPTGLETLRYQVAPSRKADERVRLVWIGSQSSLRYLDLILPALEKVGSILPGIVLRLISDEFADLKNMPVEKHRWSQDSQYAALAECDIGLSPLADDGFARGKCGFKTLQYQCAGLPVVCSPVGVNEEMVRHGMSGFHARATEEWVDFIVRLARDKSLRLIMGQEGRKAAAAFDREIIGKRFVSLVSACLAENRLL